MDEQYFQKIKKGFLKLKDEIIQLLNGAEKDSFTHLQNYIYFSHYPIFSFTEAILILCENKKPHAAQVLLRTLFEAHIDVIYHQLENSEQKLAFSAKRMFDARITILDEISKLIEKYPNLESQDTNELFNKKYLVSAIADQKQYKEAILKAHPQLTGTKYLKDKAKLCDEGGVGNAEKGHFARMYSLIYRQLSPMTHLTIEGLQTFIEHDEYGKIFFHDGNDEDLIAAQAVEISIAFSKDLYDNNVIIGDQISTINEIEKLISQAEKQTPRSVEMIE